MRQHGLTLLELLMALAIMSVILAFGIPSLSQQIENNRTKSTTMDLFAAVQTTRHAAVTANRRATLRHLGTWQDGWEIFIDDNDNGHKDEFEKTVLRNAVPVKKVRIKANTPLKDYVSFLGTGESRKANGHSGGALQIGTFTVCPETGGPGYQLILSRGGRMRMRHSQPSACDAP